MKICKSCNGSGQWDDSGNPSEPCPDCMGSGIFIPDDEKDKYEMSYHCPDCGEEWKMIHSCACNDKCPGCNKEYTPDEVIDLY